MASQSWSIKILSTKWLEFSRGVRINMAGTVIMYISQIKDFLKNKTFICFQL